MQKTSVFVLPVGLVLPVLLYLFRDNTMLKDILDWLGSPGIGVFLALYFPALIAVVAYLWKKGGKSKNGTSQNILNIGAKVREIKTAGYYAQLLGDSSEGDEQVVIDVILALSKPMTLDILSLELWGQRFEAKIQRDVAPFDLIKLTPLTLRNSRTYTLAFDVPKGSAVDTEEARIYALSGNLLEWFSKPFAITFGGSK